jgi:hypothetical protein
MERSQFAVIADQTMGQINDLIQRKGKEYSTGDAFSNFKDASKGLSFHDRPEMVAWEFAVKHMQSIKDIISGKVPADDNTIHEKFNDAIVYMLLIKGMMVERSAEKVEKIKFTNSK